MPNAPWPVGYDGKFGVQFWRLLTTLEVWPPSGSQPGSEGPPLLAARMPVTGLYFMF